ncbi:TonB-dependent receptor [Pseudoxanthomonas yeongjuensis]|uniref:TonB-dependent receptor n=1 Tax=Pseudoxanthomonas yeongjuensis TaxID=377616 RepID=UPI0013918070|nr:TonB-dependent receptor [Pseudoxanthomonas yeongjuensis]KAF1716334.1 TonB-dependent receptor [Pseudoxanthomonas yeongjuensis]
MKRHDTKRGGRRIPSTFARLPLAAAIYLAVGSAAFAQEAAPAPAPQKNTEAATLDTITVTAQKRTENLQKVPISIQVLGNEKLEELNVTDFEDYVKYLPSVSYQTFGPGFAQIYMRGVSSGGDGNHSGPLPSVGVYLDEQPVTTIQGPLDIHIYDVARVEVLAGPQGTLYGASSQAGTMRIITNKPDPSGFEAGYSLEANSVSHGGIGHIAEGFVNIPVTDTAAIRLVGWNQHDAGYIDNREGDRQFPIRDTEADPDAVPSWGGVVSNRDCTSTDLLVCTGRAKDNYNDVDTTGARLALKVNLNDNWTISPTVMGQTATANGSFAFDENVGDLAVSHAYRERSEDKWVQAALTVEGKIGNFDVTYAFAHLKRDDEVDSDYSDYSFWYDTLYAYGGSIYNDNGDLINPSQYIKGKDGYKKTSHELRIASPQENRLRFVGGLFWQDQRHDIQQDYIIDGLATDSSVPGWPGTLWLTKQIREDHDEAVFGELSFDFTDKLTATAGFRSFRVDNTLKGFHGFRSYIEDDPDSDTDAFCANPDTPFMNSPCVNIDKGVREHDTIGKFNLTYHFDDSKMVYATWSEGYRPGGNNRRGSLPPYMSDYLTNYELGWKTTWFDNSLSFNGSVFRQEWKDFQFAILGANGLTEIKNANQARINGMEMELNWAATYNLNISGGAAFYDAKLTENFCGLTDAEGTPITDCPVGVINPDTGEEFAGPEAPSGTRLPVTPKFKGNLTARYNFNLGGFDAYVQGAVVHVGQRTSDLRLAEREILGSLPAYTTADFSAGIAKGSWAVDLFLSNAFDERAVISRFAQCAESVCGAAGVVPEYPNGQIYTVTNQPRMFGVRFSQKF